jgi:hypothetical protein
MAGKNIQKQRLDVVIFDVIVLCFFLLLAVLSLKFNPRARSFPLALGVIGTVMMFLQFLVDAFPGMRSKLRFVGQTGTLGGKEPFMPTTQEEAGAKQTAAAAPPAPENYSEWRRVFRVVFWLLVFIALLGWTHYLLAVTAFIFLITKIEGKEGWGISIGLALMTATAFYVLFDLLLKANL